MRRVHAGRVAAPAPHWQTLPGWPRIRPAVTASHARGSRQRLSGATHTVFRPLKIALAMPHALIVEDDPNSLSGLSAILAADGFSVDTATTIAEARAALTRFIPDVVLVDLNLPDGSGLDLLQHLPAHPPGGACP